jgi:predicted solute-binding protein
VSRPVRLGAVSYLNVRPLVYGLDRRPDIVSLRFDVPAVCAELLARGEIDLGMVPSITYLDRLGDRVVPGVCIGSEGPVASVALFSRVPVRDIRRVALDSSSRTSAALTRILCQKRFGISPAFVPHAPDLPTMLAGADAALLIGDPALFADIPPGVDKIDLGAAWTDMTELPFVWAFWSGPAGPVSGDVLRLLQASAETGMQHSDEIADAYCSPRVDRQQLARRYLRENLRFHFDDRALAGLRLYYREASELGLAPSGGGVEFFETAARVK